LTRHGKAGEVPVDLALLSNTYNLSVNAPAAWQNSNWGQGVAVAVVDSGVEAKTANGKFKTDFGQGNQNRLQTRVSMVEDSSKTKDRYGHGTAVAGIIGGDGAISAGRYVGMAPRANLVSIKVGGDDGTGYESDLVAGLQWLYDRRDKLGVRVINLSVTAATSQDYHTSPLDAAVEVMWFNGFVVVVSAGNYGDPQDPGTLYPPANDPFVITVGGTNEHGSPTIADDTITDWSAWGADGSGGVKPDLVAPGVLLVTTLAPDSLFGSQQPGKVVDSNYLRFSGTSASAAVVSGAVALLLTQEPNLTPDQVKHRLMLTASQDWPAMDSERAGSGYLDVGHALSEPDTDAANQGITVSRFLTPPGVDITWDGVNWGGVNWGGVNWGGVNWGGVNWGGVNWGGVNWGASFEE
jgi:serine protease AprX